MWYGGTAPKVWTTTGRHIDVLPLFGWYQERRRGSVNGDRARLPLGVWCPGHARWAEYRCRRDRTRPVVPELTRPPPCGMLVPPPPPSRNLPSPTTRSPVLPGNGEGPRVTCRLAAISRTSAPRWRDNRRATGLPRPDSRAVEGEWLIGPSTGNSFHRAPYLGGFSPLISPFLTMGNGSSHVPLTTMCNNPSQRSESDMPLDEAKDELLRRAAEMCAPPGQRPRER